MNENVEWVRADDPRILTVHAIRGTPVLLIVEIADERGIRQRLVHVAAFGFIRGRDTFRQAPEVRA